MITVDRNPFIDTTPSFRGARYEMPEPVDPTAHKMLAGAGKGLSARDFISPTAGRAGSVETAEAKDAAVRPEVKR